MDRNEAIEIPFGAKDSELKGWEYTIPESMEARIKDGKIIVREKESEDERIRKELIRIFKSLGDGKIPVDINYADIFTWLEKQRSQNLANSEKTCKDEPKFKVGDWIVYNEDICQIVKREEGCNKLVTNFGIEKELVNERNLSTARLWTIQDAKDGDVLATKKSNPFIYDKNRYNNGLAYYYAGLDVNKELTLKSPHHMLAHFGELRSVFPATKEQRDFLFQKMKEAGYEWDAEKKELKRIEQNSTWSEEDEEMLKDIIQGLKATEQLIFTHNAQGKTQIQGRIDWLKSLKERYTWKPSDEQIE